VSRFPEPPDPDDWQPATSRPGELFTFEGRMRAGNAFLRGLRKRDPRLKDYRRMMRRTGLVFFGLALTVLVAGVVLTALG
jgi:hypothetical protein